MQIMKLDLKDRTRLKIQHHEDLLVLKDVIKTGDVVGKNDFRSVQVEGARGKKPAYIKIRVERVEMEGTVLKLLGPIVEAPEYVTRGYHSFKLKEGDVIDIWKDWRKSEIMRLKEASRYRGLRVLICVMDEREADIALATEIGWKMLGSIRKKGGGKCYDSGEDADRQFIANVRKGIEEHTQEVKNIIIAGPGFKKDELYKILPEEIKKKCLVESCSVTGVTGINEVIKRGYLDKVITNLKISQETKLVEEFLEEIGKDSGMVVYGLEEVERAAEMMAVEKLLVSEKLMDDERVEGIMKKVEEGSGEIIIIHTSHEAGRMFEKLSGIAAFLRFRIE